MALAAVATPALLASMLALALAAVPHCALMCGAPCAAVLHGQRGATQAAFQAGRLVSYAAVGAVLAFGVGELGAAAQVSRALHPLWTAWHAAALLWGLWLLVTGRQPIWAESRPDLQPVAWVPRLQAGGGAVLATRPAARRSGPWWALAAGLLWSAWPCGMLHSALLVASLGPGAGAGAALMLVFGVVSGLGLIAAPALWRRVATPARQVQAARVAGLLLCLASAWALAHRSGFLAWCFGAD